MSNDVKLEQAVAVCPQCEGEGGYPDGVDEAACHTECTRCAGNGWIVDLTSLYRHQPERDAILEEAARFVEQRIGDTFLLAEELRALKATPAPAQEREAVLEEAAKACEKQQRIFASSKYAAGQPMSSFGERFAAGRCAEAIRALKTTPAPAVSRDDQALFDDICDKMAEVVAPLPGEE